MNTAALIFGAGILASVGGYALYRRRGRVQARARAVVNRRDPVTPEDARRALEANQGNVKRAATQLRVAEKTLHALFHKHADLRDYAHKLRLRHSRTGYGRPPYKTASAFGRFAPETA